jgi:hypothetical protein
MSILSEGLSVGQDIQTPYKVSGVRPVPDNAHGYKKEEIRLDANDLN